MKRIILLLMTFYLLGCSSTKTATTSAETRVPAKFDFSPPSQEQVGSTGITIALIKPSFVKDHPENYVDPISDMANSMANDFNELLSAKGFKIRGPFQSMGAMTYTDQQGSDFCMYVEINLEPHSTDKYVYHAGYASLGIAPFYKMSGEITFSGSFNIVARSPKNVLLWTKSIDLDPATYTYAGSIKWNGMPTLAEQMKQDNVVYNIVARQLEKYYNNALNLAWQQIDPNEMKEVASQAKEADKHSN